MTMNSTLRSLVIDVIFVHFCIYIHVYIACIYVYTFNVFFSKSTQATHSDGQAFSKFVRMLYNNVQYMLQYMYDC